MQNISGKGHPLEGVYSSLLFKLFTDEWGQIVSMSRTKTFFFFLCDPIDGSPPGSFVLGILQAGILEWVAISFSNVCMHAKLHAC